ncbi:MAG TPA: carboxypeptidase-like regulatory domain-containing protein [Thermogutta sp.]|nr:carboxypeptidase-like regulatory domain-containing protein [Thermogutta sp.]HOP78000.1 carboxypeptidase-like regulatory domain-containing protein [Thermogutta sp.]HPU07464.1 carboxypeptidase-like regulatory domain-containing protein [Thermogutta sp.]HQF14403.1 carboxypeptidase-like regulatory domain-containing protein [Thermogutta sp.]
MSWRLGFAGLLILLLAIAGCGSKGPKLARVRGKVTLDGQALPNALVTFMPEGGGVASSGTTNANGEYELVCPQGRGAVVGKHKVSVRTLPPQQSQAQEVSSDDPSYLAQYSGQSSATAQPFVEKIPPRYNTQTELVKEVKPGSNEINLDLTTSP